ncbi:unnamed protein product, partial [Didymodactylos carnosus]
MHRLAGGADFLQERAGTIIPLNNVNGRLEAIFGISNKSVKRLKAEMRETLAVEKEQQSSQHSLRRTTSASASSSSSIPRALSPLKHRAGRPKILLTELQRDTIRLTFHLLLKDRVYPTLENILSALPSQDEHFPIKSKAPLHREMKRLGFTYGQTRKAPVLLDGTPFQAQRAIYFRKLEELRSSNAIIYYHDEIWCSKNEEKTNVWFDENGHGRLRNSEGMGQRLAISGLVSLDGFHLRSLDIFKCDDVHSMDSAHFSSWMETAASTLRIDNATWHNKLTPESEAPKRAWKKQLIVDWLINKKVPFWAFMTLYSQPFIKFCGSRNSGAHTKCGKCVDVCEKKKEEYDGRKFEDRPFENLMKQIKELYPTE